MPGPEAANTGEWWRADLRTLIGHGNAQSVARVLSAVMRILSAVSLDGTVDGWWTGCGCWRWTVLRVVDEWPSGR
ncbi:hypothetical protein [Actinomadura sp. B10D3]|uniref:hypothetical protein n=1 Tax=Actinomadura sp. B10D3 TaxID=3153557 RepID=UPI00325D8A8B